MEHALDVSTCDNVITHHLVDPYVPSDTLHSYTCTHRHTDTHSEESHTAHIENRVECSQTNKVIDLTEKRSSVPS